MKPIEAALTKLVKEQPWFAALALRLKVVAIEGPEPGFEEMNWTGTDGRSLYYRPKNFDCLSSAHQQMLVAHEVLHVAFLNFSKSELGPRDPMLANVAQDYQINAELQECGFTLLPQGVQPEERFKGKSWQEIYSILEKEGKAHKKCGCVHIVEGGTQADDEKLKAEWAIAVQQAFAVTDKAGQAPASLKRAVDKMLFKNNWRDVVGRFLTKLGDVAWTRPNKRLISSNIYLPGAIVDSLGTLVIAVDTSGSISARMLSIFAAESNGILSVAGWPQRVLVIYCDAQINAVEEVQGQITLEPHGGGGTAFQPVFDYLEREGVQPDVLFYLTDLYGDNPRDPGYPVVWVTPLGSPDKAPFGELIKIDINAE